MKNTIHARYTMLADFYLPTSVRDESGQVLRNWDYDNPVVVQNLTEGILGGGIRVVGSTEQWGEDYEEIEWAKMHIARQTLLRRDSMNQPLPEHGAEDGSRLTITRRFRVGNIRDRVTGEVLWTGDDGDPIEFNIQGVTPIRDPFGGRGAVEYELLIKGVTDD